MKSFFDFHLNFPFVFLLVFGKSLSHASRLQPQTYNQCFCTSPGVCQDLDSFPNIGQAFRSYDLIMGDPLNSQADPGYRSHVFDEATERSGPVRFGNTAGNELNSCSANLDSQFYSDSKLLLKDTISTTGSSSGTSIGSEVEISVEYEGVGAKKTIPPLYESSFSNSKALQTAMRTLDTKEFSLTKTVAKCSRQEFRITNYQHPKFTESFKNAAVDLSQCYSNQNQKACITKFLNDFGTHYIQRAISGSKLIELKFYSKEEANELNQHGAQECSKSGSTFSLFGMVSRNSASNECKKTFEKELVFSKKVLQRSFTVTAGSSPKETIEDWADQDKAPEVIFKQLRPLSDLFTDAFMKDEIQIPYNMIRPWLSLAINNYCAIFKDEHRCNFVVNFPYTVDNCRHLNGVIGEYSGPVDANFLPSSKDGETGTLMNVGTQAVLYSGSWKAGCPVMTDFVRMPQSDCRWLGTNLYQKILQCDGNEVAVGACKSGTYMDCPNSRLHELKCCKRLGFYYTNCQTTKSSYGVPIDCKFQGGILEGACGSGRNKDCHGDYNEGVCCSGFLHEVEIIPSYSTCRLISDYEWGWRLECNEDEVIAEICGSGATKDCKDQNQKYYSHGIVCCKLVSK